MRIYRNIPLDGAHMSFGISGGGSEVPDEKVTFSQRLQERCRPSRVDMGTSILNSGNSQRRFNWQVIRSPWVMAKVLPYWAT